MPKKLWADVDIEKLAEEVIGRNGKFHIMVSFMGIATLPAILMDRNGRLLYMNKRAEDHWKVRTKNVIGQPWPRILCLNEKDTARMAKESKAVLAANEARVFVEWFSEGTKLAHLQSVLKFPFKDDDDDTLLGVFVLPHNTGQ